MAIDPKHKWWKIEFKLTKSTYLFEVTSEDKVKIYADVYRNEGGGLVLTNFGFRKENGVLDFHVGDDCKKLTEKEFIVEIGFGNVDDSN